jgi:hypothetical protein
LQLSKFKKRKARAATCGIWLYEERDSSTQIKQEEVRNSV